MAETLLVKNPAQRRAKSRVLTGVTALLATLTVGLLLPGSPWQAWLQAGRPGRIAPYRLVRQTGVDPDKEIALYRQRVQQDPAGFLNQIALASAYLRRARLSGETSWYLLAEQSAQRSLSHFRQNPGALLVLARIAQARHDFHASLKLVEQAAVFKPTDLGIQSNKVTIYLGLGQIPAAAAAAEVLVERAPGLDAYAQRGLVRLASGDEAGAIADFEHGITLEQTGQMGASAQIRAWLGRLYAQRGHLDWAEDLYREALRIQPDMPLVLGLQADASMRRKQYREAGRQYAQAFLRSQLPLYRIGQARAAAAQGDARAAEGYWTEAESMLRRDLSSGSYGHRRDLARLLLEHRPASGGAEALQLMQAEIRQRSDSETLNLLAWSLARQGRWQPASARLAQVRATGEHNTETSLLAAWIAQGQGRYAQAQALLQQARQRDPLLASDPAYAPLLAELP